jgi:hypothetical protein
MKGPQYAHMSHIKYNVFVARGMEIPNIIMYVCIQPGLGIAMRVVT